MGRLAFRPAKCVCRGTCPSRRRHPRQEVGTEILWLIFCVSVYVSVMLSGLEMSILGTLCVNVVCAKSCEVVW